MKIVHEILNGKTGFTQEQIVPLLESAREHYRRARNVIFIPASRVFFIGDLHGDLDSARKIAAKITSSDYHAVFLGDYADRGPAQIDTVNLVAALKLTYPDRVSLLRGNHESLDVSSRYGFRDTVERDYSRELYYKYLEFFEVLPIAGISENGIFVCHGGVPSNVTSLDDLNRLDRFNVDLVDQTIAELLWNDPKEMDMEFTMSMRGGAALYFGRKAFDNFVRALGIKLFIRAHEAFPEGVRRFFDGRLISVFSTSYNGRVTPKLVRIDNDLTVKEISI